MRGLLLLYLELIGFPRAFNWRCGRNSTTLLHGINPFGCWGMVKTNEKGANNDILEHEEFFIHND